MQLADPADERPPASTRAARPGWRFGSSVSGRERRRREAEPAADQLDDALGVVEVVRPRRPVPGGRLGRARQREPEPPPLVGRRVVRRAVALADLEDRDVVASLAQVGRDDLEQAAEQALAQHRVLARQRVGDGDRPAGRALLRLARELARRRGPGTLDHLRRDEGEGDGLGQPGTRERLADGVAHLERVVAVGRHRRVRQGRRDELVAADADDLLGDVGLDREVAAPGRDGRVDDVCVAGIDVERLGAGGDGDPRPRLGRGRLDPDPGQERPLLVGSEVRARAAGRPAPAGTRRARAAARRVRCRRRPARPRRRPTRR